MLSNFRCRLPWVWLVAFASLVARSASAERVPAVPRCTDGVSGVVGALRHYDIVAVAEVHQSARMHEFLRTLISDARLPMVAQDIVVEFGNSRYPPIMDRYMAGDSVPQDSVQLAWRNTTQMLVFDTPLYARFFATVRAVNRSRPSAARLRVLLADPPIDWDVTRKPEDFPHDYGYRDPDWFRVVQREVIDRHHHALVIAGGAHLLREDPSSGFQPRPLNRAGLGEALERVYAHRSLVLWTVISPHNPLVPYLAPCRPGELVRVAGTKLGALSSHLMLPGSLEVFRLVNAKRVPVVLADSEFPPIAKEVDRVLDLVGDDRQVDADLARYADIGYVNELRRRAVLLTPIFGEDVSPTIDSLALAARARAHN